MVLIHQSSDGIDHQIEYHKIFGNLPNDIRQAVPISSRRVGLSLLIFSSLLAGMRPFQFKVKHKLLLLIFRGLSPS